jgi:nicotinamide riboside kinase
MATDALLLGGECTGKTALAHALADSMTDRPVVIAQEALRSFVDHHKRTPTQTEQRDGADAREQITAPIAVASGDTDQRLQHVRAQLHWPRAWLPCSPQIRT